MSDLMSHSEAPSDAELISAVRTGNADAYGQLFARHRSSTERLAAQVARRDDVDALDTPVEFHDPALEQFEHSATARAFASLPERWQLAL